MTIVISEHRVHYLKDIADRAILIENGKIKKEIRGEDFRNLSNKEANAMGLRSINCYLFLHEVLTITREKTKLN